MFHKKLLALKAVCIVLACVAVTVHSSAVREANEIRDSLGYRTFRGEVDSTDHHLDQQYNVMFADDVAPNNSKTSIETKTEHGIANLNNPRGYTENDKMTKTVREQHSNGEMFSRHGGNGQTCVTSHATVRFAATEHATLYLNGVELARTRSYTQYREVSKTVCSGDVFGIAVDHMQGWHGVITDVEIDSHHYRTGREEFKVFPRLSGRKYQDRWNRRGRKLCSWKPPFVEQRPKDDTFCKTFPYRTGAKYVWARDAPNQGGIYLRFVVGGEKCVSHQPGADGDEDEEYDEDQNTEPNPIGSTSPSPSPFMIEAGSRCNCTETEHDNSGECYEFIGEMTTSNHHTRRPCVKRNCLPKYECVENGDPYSNQCIRRYATREIQKIVENYGTIMCEYVSLDPVKPFYAPYV